MPVVALPRPTIIHVLHYWTASNGSFTGMALTPILCRVVASFRATLVPPLSVLLFHRFRSAFPPFSFSLNAGDWYCQAICPALLHWPGVVACPWRFLACRVTSAQGCVLFERYQSPVRVVTSPLRAVSRPTPHHPTVSLRSSHHGRHLAGRHYQAACASQACQPLAAGLPDTRHTVGPSNSFLRGGGGGARRVS